MNRWATVRVALAALALSALAFIHSTGVLLFGLALVSIGWAAARPGWRATWTAARPIVVFTAVCFVFNAWFGQVEPAVELSLRIAVALGVAAWLNVTTSATATLDVVTPALAPLVGRARADRFALLVALMLRSMPQLNQLVSEVQDARRARGMERSLRAFAVPVLIRSIRASEELGDALIARGIAD